MIWVTRTEREGLWDNGSIAMPVTRLEIKQFSAFGEVALDFSPGLNVFIGENATGKSHLMKLAYALIKPFEDARADTPIEPGRLIVKIKDKLAGVFQPEEGRLGRLVYRRVGKNTAKVSLGYGRNREIGFTLTAAGPLAATIRKASSTPRSIFVPSREALALYEGFIAAYEGRELSFDETYYDLCKALSATPLRGPRMKAARRLVRPLEGVLGGKVVLSGGRFYLKSEAGMGTIEAHLLAEGYRKIASIVHLISNGSLMKNAVLFWDEPEANLNPRLITKVAQTLRFLAAAGVQILMATHDYLLSHELALAAEYGTDPSVATRFFAFTREQQSGAVRVTAADHLAELSDNPILQEFAAHYDREQRLFMGVDGGGRP